MSKKGKVSKGSDVMMEKEVGGKGAPVKPLQCVLPSGRSLSLRIVVGAGKSSKIGKVDKKKSKTILPSPPPDPKINEDKIVRPNVSFFDKFVSVVEELQKKE